MVKRLLLASNAEGSEMKLSPSVVPRLATRAVEDPLVFDRHTMLSCIVLEARRAVCTSYLLLTVLPIYSESIKVKPHLADSQ